MEILELPTTVVNYHSILPLSHLHLSWKNINCDFACFALKNKKIETYSECYGTLHILYMYFYRGVRKVTHVVSMCALTWSKLA